MLSLFCTLYSSLEHVFSVSGALNSSKGGSSLSPGFSDFLRVSATRTPESHTNHYYYNS
jgi:hypothetical protein